MRRLLRAIGCVAVVGVVAASPVAAQEYAKSNEKLLGIIDEIRFGLSHTIDSDVLLERFRSKEPDGVRFNGQIFLGPWGQPYSNPYLDGLLRPRVLLGGTVATNGGSNQVFAGIAGTYPIPFLPDRFFMEGTLAATVHDGPLRTPGDIGSDLGCRVLFRSSVALGVEITEHLRIVALADHSSHADACPGHTGNSGLTNAGVYVGYRF